MLHWLVPRSMPKNASAFCVFTALSFAIDSAGIVQHQWPDCTARVPTDGPSIWLNQFRRLRVRYEKRVDIHEAFLSLSCVWICWKSLRKDWITA